MNDSTAGRATLATALLVGAFAAGTVRASPLFDLLGAAAGPHPFTAGAMGSGAELTWANPARLTWATPGLELGLIVVAPDLRVDLCERPAGVDVPATIYDLREQLPDGDTRRLEQRPLPTERLRSPRADTSESDVLTHLWLGFVQPLVPGYLTLGFSALFPSATLQSQDTFFSDERAQYFSNRLHFELYGDRLQAQSLALALGARPVPWLGLGAGLALTTESVAETEVYIGDSAYQETAMVNSRIRVAAGLVPHFGLTVEPLAGLSLSMTLHLPAANPVAGQSDVQFWSYPYPEGETSVVQRFAFSHGSVPLRAALGAAWREVPAAPDDLAFGAGLNLRWAHWSDYRDRHDEAPTLAWSDTFDLAASGELAWSQHRFALGVSWVPSPVPDQRGRSSYVDNDRVGASLGWRAELPVGDATLSVGLALQLHRLLPRSITKDLGAPDPVRDELPAAVDIRSGELAPESEGLQTNNPGYPGYSSSGWLFASGLSLGLTL